MKEYAIGTYEIELLEKKTTDWQFSSHCSKYVIMLIQQLTMIMTMYCQQCLVNKSSAKDG